METRTKVLLGASLIAALTAGTLGLVAVEAQEKEGGAAPPAPAPAAAADHGALVKSLGDSDFAARTRAYEDLRRAGPAARRALEEGARSEDPQIRWSCGRLLRPLDGARPRERPGTLRFLLEDGGVASPAAPREAEEDGPEYRDAPEPRRWDVRMLDEDSIRRSLEEARRRLADLDRQFREIRIPEIPLFGPGGLAGDARIERRVVVDRDGERTDVSVGADGKVRVRTSRRAEDGKMVGETLEAPSLEALEKERPEVHAEVKDLLGDRIRIRTFAGPLAPPHARGAPEGLPRGDPWRSVREIPVDPKPVLGVTVSEAPPVLRTQLALPADEGIVVEEVMEGTLAGRLGLRRHDVILSVNGVPVSTAGDVRAAVGAVEEGGVLRLGVVRDAKATEVAGTR